jgi:hypothetical protein
LLNIRTRTLRPLWRRSSSPLEKVSTLSCIWSTMLITLNIFLVRHGLLYFCCYFVSRLAVKCYHHQNKPLSPVRQRTSSQVKSSQSPIIHFSLCKEQQHSQKQELFVIMVQLKLLRGFKPAGLTVCIFLSLFLFNLFAHLEFPCKYLYSWGYIAVSKLSPDVWSPHEKVRILLCFKSTILTTVNRYVLQHNPFYLTSVFVFLLTGSTININKIRRGYFVPTKTKHIIVISMVKIIGSECQTSGTYARRAKQETKIDNCLCVLWTT